ncbi:hypothetical protein ACQW02_09695 [Humitalea sp. 24SJ18S-53]|uniref:hypothetical protein n=1 Tax=Humitalea sp. 24SJ18S-53 TaxID=3422307 RepID=UPI003D667AD5
MLPDDPETVADALERIVQSILADIPMENRPNVAAVLFDEIKIVFENAPVCGLAVQDVAVRAALIAAVARVTANVG